MTQPASLSEIPGTVLGIVRDLSDEKWVLVVQTEALKVELVDEPALVPLALRKMYEQLLPELATRSDVWEFDLEEDWKFSTNAKD